MFGSIAPCHVLSSLTEAALENAFSIFAAPILWGYCSLAPAPLVLAGANLQFPTDSPEMQLRIWLWRPLSISKQLLIWAQQAFYASCSRYWLDITCCVCFSHSPTSLLKMPGLHRVGCGEKRRCFDNSTLRNGTSSLRCDNSCPGWNVPLQRRPHQMMLRVNFKLLAL